MSGIAALFLERGAPLDRALFLRIARAVPFRDPHQTWYGDGAAVAAGSVAEARGVVCAFDGRLDNRAELATLLGLDAAAGDAHLTLEALARWDSGAPSRMLGDFAFVFWDSGRRRALLGRDHMGLRPLHYTRRPGALLCASDIAHLLADPLVSRRPNPRVAAQYLACDIDNGAETLYDGIYRVRPAHCAVVDGSGAQQHRYWSAEPPRQIRYASDDDYAAQCRELLIRSVAARAGGEGPVAATLSGGIDSSSVALTAHRLVKDAPAPALFSMIFPDHPESDERRFIDAVAERCGATPVYVTPSAPAGSLAFRASAWMNAPAMAADRMSESMWQAMRARGYRAALTGAGGDFTYAGSIFHYADLLRAGRLPALIRRYRDDRRADGTGKNSLAWLQAGVWPALPLTLKRALRPLARRAGRRAGMVEWRPWLRLPVDREPLPDEPRGGSFATEDLLRGLLGGFHSYVLEGSERAAAEAGIELRHPLLDVRLTEFVLAIPEEQRRRGPILKFVLRRALRDQLPLEIATRTTKGDFAHCVWDAVESVGGEAFYRSLAIADAGWVDGDAILRLYRRMRDDVPRGHEAYGQHIPEIWMVTAVELWFRAAFGAAGPVAAQQTAL